MKTEYLQVMTTLAHKNDAQHLAAKLLESRLAACVQIFGPLTSHFWWNDKLDAAEEYLCLIKSRTDLYDQLEEMIINNHPYQVPEIVALPIVMAGKGYLAWLQKELAAGK